MTPTPENVNDARAEKSPREIAVDIVARWKADIGKVVKYERMEDDIAQALRDRDERLHLLIVSALRETKENVISINRALEIIDHAIKQN